MGQISALMVALGCAILLAIKCILLPSVISYLSDKNVLIRYVDAIYQAITQQRDYINEYKKISRIVDSNSCNTLIKDTSTLPNVVLILGESTQRNYMSLYGYKLNTTPKLQNLERNGNLIVFDNIISPHSHTDLSLQKVLAFSNYENASVPWYMQQNLLDVLNLAGYETYWLNNQEAISIYGNAPEVISSRAKHTKFSSLNDSFSSGRIYDEVLLTLLDEAMQTPKVKNFYVIHLMGHI